MKVLQAVKPTPEQLSIIQRNDSGVTLIRGSAGSGKTTTALLRMKFLAAVWQNRHRRLAIARPVEMLVLTFNKTLRGYINELAMQEIMLGTTLKLEVKTFAKWARDLLDESADHDETTCKLKLLAKQFPKDHEFIMDEAQYAMGRFLPVDYSEYLNCKRIGRGLSPRCDRSLRRKILDVVIRPYMGWKKQRGFWDFNDLAINLAQSNPPKKYDIIVIDEAQDLSANEVRAIQNCLAKDHTITYVLDGAQRIYPKSFIWREVGLKIRPHQTYSLQKNYRNTKEIAAFITPLLDGVDIGGDDGTLPNFQACTRTGPLPSLIVGIYSSQLDWAIRYLRKNVDLRNESVAFLKPRGGNWFSTLSQRLFSEGFEYVKLTRNSEWPKGNENIALSTMHSAKGLEFDHVIILGLNSEVTPHGQESGDNQLDSLRRLLAMALGRARKSVVIGYKPTEASSLISYFKPGTFKEYKL